MGKLFLVLAVMGPFVAWGQNLPYRPYTKGELEDAPYTLESSLYRLSLMARVVPNEFERFAATVGLKVVGNEITVIVVHEGPPPTAGIRSLGGEVVQCARAFRLCEVRVPVTELAELASLPGIVFVRRPYVPVPLATSEGLPLIGAPDWHADGDRGAGIRVAVIDLGFRGYTQAVSAGELANVILARDYTGTEFETGTEHGTACAEIVHDVAPEAELLLMKIGNEVDLANAVEDAIDNGVHIISHSVGWLNTNFYDGTGLICDIVDRAASAGILWVNAAGNYSDGSHWEGDWNDPDGDGTLDFAPGDEVNDFFLPAGTSIAICLTWNDWPNTAEDYDLFLYGPDGTQVAASKGLQNGTQPPTEAIYYTTPVAGRYGFAIRAYSVSTYPRLEVFCAPNGLELEHPVAASSIPAPGNAASVVTVGAIAWQDWETGPQEPFSSRGPTNASKFSGPRVKPDISGPDGVSTWSYGPEGFWGTSAAAPHVAGAAALVWGANPAADAAWIRAYLEGNAVDMGAPGKDNVYGHGRLSLSQPRPTGECMDLLAGWNLISLPIEPDDPAPEAVFDEVPGTLYLYRWDPDTEAWLTAHEGTLTQVSVLGGYWLWLPEPTTVCVTGTEVTGDREIPLGAAGWQMFGVPYPVAWGDVVGVGSIRVRNGTQVKTLAEAVAAGWLYHTVWEYDTAAGEWITTTLAEGTTLVPEKGYYIYTYVDDLTLLASRLVWQGEAYGPEPVWYTENLAGQYLVDGVYLYQVQVKVGGTRITTSLKKLAIYR